MEKNNIEKFYDNYKNVIQVIQELKQKASKEELKQLEIYEKSLKALIFAMVEYVKIVFATVIYKTDEEYKSQEDFLVKSHEVNQSRIIYHNDLISKIKLADMICKRLDCEPLYGELGKFCDNADPLLQKTPQDKSLMSQEAKDKRQETFRWACNVILLSLARNKAEEYSDFITNPQSFRIVADFYKYLGLSEIYENFDNKINGR